MPVYVVDRSLIWLPGDVYRLPAEVTMNVYSTPCSGVVIIEVVVVDNSVALWNCV
jgi:hypothetical protein